jgi:hypothetical protein
VAKSLKKFHTLKSPDKSLALSMPQYYLTTFTTYLKSGCCDVKGIAQRAGSRQN